MAGKRRRGAEVPILDARLEHELVEQDTILPSQWRTATVPETNERALMRAVLERAAADLRHAPPWSRPFRSAWRWFREDRRDFLFAFETICDVLDFDAPRLRAGIVARFTERAAEGAAVLKARRERRKQTTVGEG